MAPLLQKLQTHETLHSAARFAIVGMMGTLIDLALFTLLHVLVGLPNLLANTLSYGAGILNNYTLHRSWTFAQRTQAAQATPAWQKAARRTAFRQFAQFMAASLSALALNNLIVFLLTPVFHQLTADAGLAALLAKACAIAAGVCWNFLASHLWIFRAAKPR